MPVRRREFARTLLECFGATSGAPLAVGRVWPPRLVVHDVVTKSGDAQTVRITPTVWIRHHLAHPVDVSIQGDAGGVGLAVGPVTTRIDAAAVALGEPTPYRQLSVPVQWDRQILMQLVEAGWVRHPLTVELANGDARRVFRWFLYLTAGPAALPTGVTVHTWAGHAAMGTWAELPTPMSASDRPPACWVARRSGARAGPASTSLVAVFPEEPPLGLDEERVGPDGTLGATAPPPDAQAWVLRDGPLEVWDTPASGPSAPRPVDTGALPQPQPCTWPQLVCDREAPLVAVDLAQGRAVRVEVPVRLPHGSGTVTLEGGELTLDGQVVAIRDGGPCTLVAGKPRQLAFRLQLGGLAVGESRLAIHFMGRPARGPRSEPEPLRVADGPRVQLERPSPPREGEPPWVVIDLGTHSTAVAAAWRSEESEHVRLVSMGPGDVLPSRVAFAATASGDHELASIWSHDIESTHRIELGPQFGDGPHPDSPVHVAASEVGRFFVKALLLEIRERAAWLPLSRCQFLVAVSPRLTSTPRLARSVEQVFTDSIREVWGPDAAQRLYFREEPLLAATPRVLADLAARPLAARERRGYWVVDFGAGTTDACGVEVHADDDGGASIGPLHVAEGGPREVGGRDVSRAFYAVLVHALVQTGGDWDLPEDRFLPSQASAAARSNRRAVAALADAVKCAPLDRLDRTVGDVAGGLHDASLVDRWGGRFALLDVLNDAVPKLAASTVAALHQQVMQAQWAHGGGGTDLQPWLDHCRAAMERFAGHLGIGAGDVIVLPIGRAVRLPAVVQGLARVFGEQRVDPVPGTLVDRGTLDARVDPKTLVALGGGLLALQAAGGRLRAPVLPVRARAG